MAGIVRLLPTGNWVLLAVAPALVFISTAAQRSYQTDFWHHLARGRYIVNHGEMLDRDIFTYTVANQPLQDANWLTQVVYYYLYEFGGLNLVQLVNSLTLSAMMVGIVYLCWRFSGSWRLAGLLGLVAFLGMWQVMIIRPQTFSMLLFVLLYLALDASERRPLLLVFPPLILGLWVNLHGGFPIGFVPIGCFLLAAFIDGLRVNGLAVWKDRRVWLLAGCLGVSLLATLANPYGWRVYEYVLLTSSVASGRPIAEWLAPGLYQVIGKVFALSVVLVMVAFALPGRRPSVRDLVLVAVFLPPAIGAIRMIPWWLMISLPIVAVQLAAAVPESWLQDPEGDRTTVASVGFFAMLLLLCFVSIPGLPPPISLAQWLGRDHRVEDDLEVIAERLRQRNDSNRRIFSRHEYGEYLGWTLQPDGYTIFMDGRIEIIPAQEWEDYWNVLHARGPWQDVLRKYDVNYLVLDASDDVEAGALLPMVEASPEWEALDRQGDSVLFVRRNKSTGSG